MTRTSDIPYVSVDSNDGKQNWVTGLRKDDKRNLSGPVYYSGYDNLSSMKNTSLWNFQSNKDNAYIKQVKLEYPFISPTNSNYFRIRRFIICRK